MNQYELMNRGSGSFPEDYCDKSSLIQCVEEWADFTTNKKIWPRGSESADYRFVREDALRVYYQHKVVRCFVEIETIDDLRTLSQQVGCPVSITVGDDADVVMIEDKGQYDDYPYDE